MDCCTPVSPVHHQLLEPTPTQTHVHRVGHPTISSSVIPFSSCLQSFPASGSFPMRQFFTSGGQSIGVSASASVHPLNIQDWFPLGLTGWISLQSKGLSFYVFAFLFCLAVLCYMWDLSSPTRDQTHCPQQWKGRVLTGSWGKSLGVCQLLVMT